jgi:hypothetical protein
LSNFTFELGVKLSAERATKFLLTLKNREIINPQERSGGGLPKHWDLVYTLSITIPPSTLAAHVGRTSAFESSQRGRHVEAQIPCSTELLSETQESVQHRWF